MLLLLLYIISQRNQNDLRGSLINCESLRIWNNRSTILRQKQHKALVVHKCICSYFIDFMSPTEHISTFHSSLSARLIFVLNPSAVSPHFKMLAFSLTYSPRRDMMNFSFSNSVSLALYLGEVIFPVDFSDAHSSHSSRSLFVFVFFLFNYTEVGDIIEPQEPLPLLPHFQLF